MFQIIFKSFFLAYNIKQKKIDTKKYLILKIVIKNRASRQLIKRITTGVVMTKTIVRSVYGKHVNSRVW